MESKSELRRLMRERLSGRDDLGETVFARAQDEANAKLSERVSELITALLSEAKTEGSQLWGAFVAHTYEPDLRLFFRRLGTPSSGARRVGFAFPRVKQSDLEFSILQDDACLSDSTRVGLRQNRFGINEPDPAHSAVVDPSDFCGFLVPGLAFDSSCRRLGRGKGYYDRLFARLQAHPVPGERRLNANENDRKPVDPATTSKTQFKIGIAFDRQILARELPLEPHDIVMDAVLTETRLFRRPEFQVSFERKIS